jgi:hypothetical protein
MKLNELPIGTRIYNDGDMANLPHFGTITGHRLHARWPAEVEITPDADAEREPYTISPSAFSPEYHGHGGTRLVTEAAYNAWREDQARSWASSTAPASVSDRLPAGPCPSDPPARQPTARGPGN